MLCVCSTIKCPPIVTKFYSFPLLCYNQKSMYSIYKFQSMQIQGELASLNIVIKVSHSYTNVINFKYKCTKNPSQTRARASIVLFERDRFGSGVSFCSRKTSPRPSSNDSPKRRVLINQIVFF